MGAAPFAIAVSHQTIPLRIGIIPFDDPTLPSGGADPSNPQRSKDQYLQDYFTRLQSLTEKRGSPFELEIVLVRGNYYQILQWMRDGLLDGAVVSPLSAYLLTHDQTLATFPVVEFRRDDPPQIDRDHSPAFVLAEINGTSQPEPNTLLKKCFDSMLESIGDQSRRQDCELRLVNHVSTTGFLYPMLRAVEYTRSEGLTFEEQRLFWKRLLAWSRFSLWHGTNERKPAGITRLSFSYHRREPLDEPLLLANSPSVLNDVLLLSVKRAAPAAALATNNDRLAAIESERSGRRLARIISGPATLWVDSAANVLPVNDSGYIGVGQWDESKRKQFADRIEGAFRPGQQSTAAALTPIQQLFSDWYDRGAYTFTVDELVELLVNDQVLRRNRCAAIVLPGGGVRATYQAVILDYLYGRKLENRPSPIAKCAEAPAFDHAGRRLQVAAVAGTSGGALLGALVTHRTTDKGWPLRNVWVEEGKIKTSPSKVFPLFGVFRWLSILVALIVFAVTAAAHLPANSKPPAELPVWYTVLFTLVIVVAPFVIWRNSLSNQAYFPSWAGLGFLVVVVIAHFFHSVSLPGDGKSKRYFFDGLVIIIVGLLEGAAFVALVTRSASVNGDLSLLSKTLRASAETELWILTPLPILAVTLGIVITAMSQGIRPDPVRVRQYGWSLIAVMPLLALAFLFFLCGLLAGVVTELEMTTEYWIWVFCSALFASKFAIQIAQMNPARGKPRLLDGLRFLVTPSGSVPFPYTPTVTLIAWGALSIGTYLVFIAPALYSGAHGRQTFERTMFETTRGSTTGMSKDELAPLIVSITALGSDVRGDRTEPGDYYAYLERWKDHIDPDAGSRVLSMTGRQFPDAVFASGSPFPIYPAAIVPIRSRDGLFVDGGYAHRVPIDAALATGASQILVVENVAYHDGAPPDSGSRVGPLTQNVPKAFNYLFDRSQTIDVQRSKSALVGAIYPDWSGEDPFLMDFREQIVNRLQAEALHDLDRDRVGRILSWGLPDVTGGSVGGQP